MIKLFKFFSTVLVGTLVDFIIFTVMIFIVSAPVAYVIGYSSGMICNFTLQKRFVFTQTREMKHTLVLALTLWVIGLALTTLLMAWLTQHRTLELNPIIYKIGLMGVAFWYNFFTRRFAFGDHRSST